MVGLPKIKRRSLVTVVYDKDYQTGEQGFVATLFKTAPLKVVRSMIIPIRKLPRQKGGNYYIDHSNLVGKGRPKPYGLDYTTAHTITELKKKIKKAIEWQETV